jgi:fructose/tagatose bisphosphate aldolase
MSRTPGIWPGDPAFNIPYLPMMEPVVQAVVEADSFALIDTARLEWIKFESKGLAAVAEEFAKWRQPAYVRLHLDHVPVIDEDQQRVDVLPIFKEAIALGYESVMIDGSRLPLDENISDARVVELAHAADVPVEAELGAVLGHEAGPLPPYETVRFGQATDVREAGRFVRETECDWLSVALATSTARCAGRKDRRRLKPA